MLFVWLSCVLTRHGEVDLFVFSYLLYAMYDVWECVGEVVVLWVFATVVVVVVVYFAQDPHEPG